MEQIKQSEDGMRQTVLLIKIGLMVFLTFACCTVFFFLVLRYKGVADTWHLITGALQPIIIGLGLAYLLTQFLGNTLEKIAGEKAGIIKSGIPAIIGETTPETKPVFAKKAREVDRKSVV